MLKRLGRKPAVQRLLGRVLAAGLKLVYRTSRFAIEPADAYARLDPHLPLIVAMWHGQHFMIPFFRRPHDDVRVLISRHGDGEINAVAADRLGTGLIRGSGDQRRRFHRKGGMQALRQMIRALDEGASVALTADVPKGPARECGPGIVLLARLSGRPILPLAVATSRRITLSSWDKAAVNLPFSRGVYVAGDLIHVPSDADEAALEAYRLKVQAALDEVTARAYAIVDRRHG